MQNYILTNNQIELLYVESYWHGVPMYLYKDISVDKLCVGDIFRIKNSGHYVYDKNGGYNFKITAPPIRLNDYWRIEIE